MSIKRKKNLKLKNGMLEMSDLDSLLYTGKMTDPKDYYGIFLYTVCIML